MRVKRYWRAMLAEVLLRHFAYKKIQRDQAFWLIIKSEVQKVRPKGLKMAHSFKTCKKSQDVPIDNWH